MLQRDITLSFFLQFNICSGTVKKPERAGSEAGAPQYDRPQTAGATNRARRVVIRDKPTQINAGMGILLRLDRHSCVDMKSIMYDYIVDSYFDTKPLSFRYEIACEHRALS